MIFLASQGSYVFHNFLEPHNHNHYTALNTSNVEINPLVLESTEFVTAVYDCLLCHQFKVTKVIVAYENRLKVKNPTKTCYPKIGYVEPFTFLYLLSNSSLRAPPSTGLAA